MIRTMKYGLMMAALVIVFYACNDDDAAPKKAPTVTTAALTNITTTSATGGGTITDDGNSTITASGIVLSRGNDEPTLEDTVFTNTVATGSFTVNITGLEFNRTYHIRAYATNKVGTSYGEAVTLNTTNDDSRVRFIYNGEEVDYGIIVSSVTGKKWLDRNLGATAVADSLKHVAAYGHYFQWGRLADGHQLTTAGTTNSTSPTDVPGHGDYIVATNDSKYNWRSTRNPDLWQGVDGINNPCPAGWRLPTKEEFIAENITSPDIGYNRLKLTLSGFRHPLAATIVPYAGGEQYNYWTSTFDINEPDADRASGLYGLGGDGGLATSLTGQGCPVRCIKD